MLQGIDGIAIIKRLKEGGVTTPTLNISALGEVELGCTNPDARPYSSGK
jgi:DNA-binding response OmpR family regulator